MRTEITSYLVSRQQSFLPPLATNSLVMEEIKDRVRRMRVERGWTQAQLAKRVGVRQQSIQQLEDGLVRRPRYMLELADALGVPPSWLRDGGDRDDTRASVGPTERKATAEQEFLQRLREAKDLVSPRTHEILLRLEKAALDGRIEDSDWELLDGIARRLEQPNDT